MSRARVRPVLSVTAASVLAVSLAACGATGTKGPAASPGTGDDTGSGPYTVDVVRTSALDPGDINDYVGPLVFGPDFDLSVTEDNFQTFNTHSTATQVVLSGKADVIVGSTIATLQAIDKGLDLQIFCPEVAGFDTRIIGTGPVTSLDYLGEHLDVPAAVESPGGSSNLLMDLALRANGQDYRVADLTNPSILEDSSLRLGALANGDVQVGLINAYQLPGLIDQLGEENVHVLSDVMSEIEPGGVFGAFAASSGWLKDNRDAAVALCASVLKGNEKLVSDFDFYKEMNDTYIVPNVEESTLKDNWDAINTHELFPYQGDLISEAGMGSMVEVARDTGIITKDLGYDDIVAADVLSDAAELAASDGGK